MLLALLEKVAQELDRRVIPYMVIGGQAVLVHAEPRTTEDIDVTLGADLDRFDEVRALVAEAGWRILVDTPEQFVERTMVLPCMDEATGLRIDIVFSRTEYEKEALGRVVRVRVGATDVCFASAEDLLIHKVIANRPRDVEDARAVLLRNIALDIAYVERWLEALGHAVDEDLVGRFQKLRATLPR